MTEAILSTATAKQVPVDGDLRTVLVTTYVWKILHDSLLNNVAKLSSRSACAMACTSDSVQLFVTVVCNGAPAVTSDSRFLLRRNLEVSRVYDRDLNPKTFKYRT